MGLPEILAKVIYETIKIFQCDSICHYFKAADQCKRVHRAGKMISRGNRTEGLVGLKGVNVDIQL